MTEQTAVSQLLEHNQVNLFIHEQQKLEEYVTTHPLYDLLKELTGDLLKGEEKVFDDQSIQNFTFGTYEQLDFDETLIHPTFFVVLGKPSSSLFLNYLDENNEETPSVLGRMISWHQNLCHVEPDQDRFLLFEKSCATFVRFFYEHVTSFERVRRFGMKKRKKIKIPNYATSFNNSSLPISGLSSG